MACRHTFMAPQSVHVNVLPRSDINCVVAHQFTYKFYHQAFLHGTPCNINMADMADILYIITRYHTRECQLMRHSVSL